MSEQPLNKDNIVAFIADIFTRRGGESYMGEEVTMAEHMLQSAGLAEAANAEDTLIAAALLHDIGHYTSEFSEDALASGQNNYHEDAGAEVIARFFPPAVTEPIKLHVAAKRFFCAVNKGYFNQLSPASVHSLDLQGGPMSEVEIIEFRLHSYYKEALRLRTWDDEGKVAGASIPAFEYYAPLLRRIVDQYTS
jgi:predicted HD phosphohydrolase